MHPSQPARRARRAAGATALALAIAATIVVTATTFRSHAAASRTTEVGSTLRDLLASGARRASTLTGRPRSGTASPPRTGGSPQGRQGGPVGVADGVLPDGVTVFRNDLPGVANLDPALLAALRRAATFAAPDGVRFTIHSAWRSRAYQEQLLQDAIDKYGSREAAARWVAPPDKSEHVSGHAIDLESGAADWLSRHGAQFGLCRIYDNEPWHYELRPDAVTDGCPARYPDAAHDPRFQ